MAKGQFFNAKETDHLCLLYTGQYFKFCISLLTFCMRRNQKLGKGKFFRAKTERQFLKLDQFSVLERAEGKFFKAITELDWQRQRDKQLF